MTNRSAFQLIGTTGHSRAPRDGASSRPDTMMSVELPLRNLEYAIEGYLLSHGTHLDTGTRVFLADVRDAIGRAASTARSVADGAGPVNTGEAANPAGIRESAAPVGRTA